MKKNPKVHIAVKIAVAVVLIAILAAVLYRASGRFLRPAYDAKAPTPAKFAKISKWLPGTTEFDLSMDVTRAMANPQIKDGISKIVKAKGGLIAELVTAIISKQDAVGMLTLAGNFGEKGATPVFAIIAQGSFDERALIPAIRIALAAGHAGLASEKLENYTLYVESDARDPFGFIVLDREHIAIGNKASLVALFSKETAKTAAVSKRPDSIIFGHLKFGPRLSALMPQGVPISSIDFESTDGKSLTAKIPSPTPAEAQNLKMFLEGVRSLLMLQEEGNASLTSILSGISAQNEGSDVIISCNTLPLLNLW